MVKNIIQVKDSIPWVRCASGNVLDAIIFGTDFETFWNHICSRPNPGHIRSRTLPVTCNISDWQSTYSFSIAKIQGPKFVLSSMEGSSIVINQHQFIHTHTCAASAKSGGQLLPLSQNRTVVPWFVRKCESSNFPHASRPSINKLLQNRHFDNIKTFVGQLRNSSV